MNDNFIFFRYNNNDNKKNNLDLSPRTHISVNSTNNNNNNNNVKINKINHDNHKNNNNNNNKKKDYKNNIIQAIRAKQKQQKRLDLIEVGIQRLITLGRQTKKYIPTKESILYKKKPYTLTNIKSKSCKKLTPFQVYENNKKFLVNSIKKNTQKILNLKTFNSGEINTNINTISISNKTSLKKKFSSNFYTPSKHYNTIICNFKNKLIKSMFEKNKVIHRINDKIEFEKYVPVHSMPNSQKYLMSCEKIVKNKNNQILNDFYIGKERILPLYKRKTKIKKDTFLTNNKHKYNYAHTENNFMKDKNKSINNANFEDFCFNIYSQIPLVELNSIHFSNEKFNNLFLNKINGKKILEKL